MAFVFKVIKNPSTNIIEKENIFLEIDKLVKKSWGKFDKEYINSSILGAYYLCLVFDKDKLVALAPLKKLDILGSDVYSFGLTVVDPDYRGMDLLKKMGFILGRKIIFENILKGRFKIEVIFITPNIRTLGTISKISDFVYPNPYDFKDGKILPADDVTWSRIKEFLKISNEKYRKLDREGSVMEGFYDDKEKLVMKKVVHSDKRLEDFGEKYLYNKPGRELVVRAIVGIRGVLNVIRYS